jgi:hypothetical protein
MVMETGTNVQHPVGYEDGSSGEQTAVETVRGNDKMEDAVA